MSLHPWPIGALTALLAAVLAAAGFYAERLNDDRHRVTLRAEVQERLVEVRDRLNSTLVSDLQLVRGLVGVINLEPGLDQARFEKAARPLFAGRTQLRNIAVAPDMVIRMMVPVAGNERAIGLDYRTNAEQFEAVDRARRTRQVVVAGPVNLVQGGVGLIARLPVFVADEAGGERFWGIVSAVIDVERLYASAGLRDPAAPIELAIRGKDASGPDGPVFFGRDELFGSDPVVTDIELPSGSWRLAALPRGGWPAAADNRWALRLAFAVLGLGVLGAFHGLGKSLRAASVARREVEAVLEGAPDAMLQVDASGRIVRVNTQAVQLFGHPREALVGEAIELLVPERVRAHHPKLRDSFFAAPGPRTLGAAGRELRGLRADGSEFPIEMTLSPVNTPRGTLVTAAIRDISERKRADEMLRESEARFRSLAENSSDWIWVLGLDGRHRYTNDRGLAMLGLDRETFLKLELTDLVHPDDLSVLNRTFRQAIEAKGGWHGVMLRWRHRDGSWRTLESNASPMFDAAGGLVGFHGVDRDATERLAAEAELERHRHQLERLVEERTAELTAAKAAAEAASVAKSAFLANMSHEIRTPLNAITGMAYLVRRSGVSAEQQQRLETLEAAARHLLAVINAILDLSKIEAGKMPLARQPVDLRALAANVRSMLAERARAKGLAFEVDVQPPEGALLGDPTRLQQALLNYADNAVKFTEAGRVRLGIHPEGEAGADGGLTVRFEVHDSGRGIAPQSLARLFGAFEQADNTSTREHGGTGLGLVITRRLAQLMGGDAGASSVPGQGSVFWFTARLVVAPAAAPAPAHEPRGLPVRAAARPAPGAKVLLAEDEPVNRTLATLLLEDLGLAVDTADDGEQATTMAAAEGYDLVLMDMQMPRVDGLEATRRIRALARHARTPIVAITANAFDSDREACLAAGMDDFVTKPIDPDALREVLVRWLAPR